MKGHGSLAELERLRKQYREEFRQAAPKVKRIDGRCFRLRCHSAVNPARLKYTGGGLRLKQGTCTRKTCPRHALEEYRRMLDSTREWRRDRSRPTMAGIWWDAVKGERRKLRRMLK